MAALSLPARLLELVSGTSSRRIVLVGTLVLAFGTLMVVRSDRPPEAVDSCGAVLDAERPGELGGLGALHVRRSRSPSASSYAGRLRVLFDDPLVREPSSTAGLAVSARAQRAGKPLEVASRGGIDSNEWEIDLRAGELATVEVSAPGRRSVLIDWDIERDGTHREVLLRRSSVVVVRVLTESGATVAEATVLLFTGPIDGRTPVDVGRTDSSGVARFEAADGQARLSGLVEHRDFVSTRFTAIPLREAAGDGVTVIVRSGAPLTVTWSRAGLTGYQPPRVVASAAGWTATFDVPLDGTAQGRSVLGRVPVGVVDLAVIGCDGTESLGTRVVDESGVELDVGAAFCGPGVNDYLLSVRSPSGVGVSRAIVIYSAADLRQRATVADADGVARLVSPSSDRSLEVRAAGFADWIGSRDSGMTGNVVLERVATPESATHGVARAGAGLRTVTIRRSGSSARVNAFLRPATISPSTMDAGSLVVSFPEGVCERSVIWPVGAGLIGASRAGAWAVVGAVPPEGNVVISIGDVECAAATTTIRFMGVPPGGIRATIESPGGNRVDRNLDAGESTIEIGCEGAGVASVRTCDGAYIWGIAVPGDLTTIDLASLGRGERIRVARSRSASASVADRDGGFTVPLKPAGPEEWYLPPHLTGAVLVRVTTDESLRILVVGGDDRRSPEAEDAHPVAVYGAAEAATSRVRLFASLRAPSSGSDGRDFHLADGILDRGVWRPAVLVGAGIWIWASCETASGDVLTGVAAPAVGGAGEAIGVRLSIDHALRRSK